MHRPKKDVHRWINQIVCVYNDELGYTHGLDEWIVPLLIIMTMYSPELIQTRDKYLSCRGSCTHYTWAKARLDVWNSDEIDVEII